MMQDEEQMAAGGADGNAPSEAPAEAAPESAESALAAAQAEIARLRDERLRALAEAENTRRRAARDRQEASQYAIANFARDLLSVADNLERALASVDAAARQADPALAALVGGIEATQRELLSVFERHGVRPIPAMGAPFDPHRHEAMFELADDSVPHGTVVHVLQPGYQLHDRTLRAARVGTSRGGAKAAPPEEGEGDAADKVSFGEGGATARYGGADIGAAGGRIDERT